MKAKAIAMLMMMLLLASFVISEDDYVPEERVMPVFLPDDSYTPEEKLIPVYNPRERAQKEIDQGTLSTPETGCFDGDADAANYAETASYAYDSALHVISDFCAHDLNKEILHEAYCNANNIVDIKEIECPVACVNGACGIRPQETFCLDTDQAGEGFPATAEGLISVFSSKGAVIGYYTSTAGTYSTWEDYCATDGRLVEYSCRKGKAIFNTIYCPCSGGRCTSIPYCMDSDGGANTKAAGKIIGIDDTRKYFEFSDVCNGNILVEQSCGFTGNVITSHQCEIGCSEGKCISEAPTEVAITPTGPICNSKTDCALEQACVNNLCSKCTVATDCGPGWQCAAGKCEISTTGITPECTSGYDCEHGKFCSSDRKCKDVVITDEASFLKELKKSLSILLEYEKILLQVERIHTLQ